MLNLVLKLFSDFISLIQYINLSFKSLQNLEVDKSKNRWLIVYYFDVSPK